MKLYQFLRNSFFQFCYIEFFLFKISCVATWRRVFQFRSATICSMFCTQNKRRVLIISPQVKGCRHATFQLWHNWLLVVKKVVSKQNVPFARSNPEICALKESLNFPSGSICSHCIFWQIINHFSLSCLAYIRSLTNTNYFTEYTACSTNTQTQLYIYTHTQRYFVWLFKYTL